jgi:hypothetical protein
LDFGYDIHMKLILAVIAYLLIAGILGWGLLLAMHGNLWLLGISFLTYVAIFAKVGCLPKSSH